MATNLKGLISKLNDTTRRALEAAAGLCLARTHYDIEIEHYLLKLLDGADNDFACIAREFALDRARLEADLSAALDKLRAGNARTPALSPSLVKMFSAAWTLGSMDYDAARIRSGFTVLALIADEELARLIAGTSRELEKIEPEQLRRKLGSILAASREQTAPVDAAVQAVSPNTKTPHLDQYTVNLTESARHGKIDPVLGREAEIRQIIDILCRRRQNNPILTGEAGVGKTAVVEGFAQRAVNEDVPAVLRGVSVRTLDLALLQAGAGIKGEFENRLKGLIQEVKSSATPIILFIDEAHTMIGAGGQAGQGDAANLLKPALARGELRTIAATTWSEYKRYFEKDPALTRRFQVVKVEEPSEEQCERMLRGVVETLERHHNVRVLDEGLRAAVRLSHRYLPERQLPDKAVSVLDTACARLSLGQNSTPPSMEDAARRRDDLLVQRRVLEREAALGADHEERLAQIGAAFDQCERELADLKARWKQESELVSRIREVRLAIEEQKVRARGSGGGGVAVEEMPDLEQLRSLNAELEVLQGESPLVRVSIDAQAVGDVVSAWTGIPVGKMLKDETAAVLSLEDHLARRVIGQRHALAAVSQRIRTSKASLEDPAKPVGVFLLAGPSGVGKTETALALADLLYGGERNLITINMSEFQEAHTVSTLKGSPPGYVGYGEGGVLTEAVRRRPYSVVLLDE
ncbi:MAG TPA: type VI secretion system ATPase TssH, partial [Bryobacteraceae bacterium]